MKSYRIRNLIYKTCVGLFFLDFLFFIIKPTHTHIFIFTSIKMWNVWFYIKKRSSIKNIYIRYMDNVSFNFLDKLLTCHNGIRSFGALVAKIPRFTLSKNGFTLRECPLHMWRWYINIMCEKPSKSFKPSKYSFSSSICPLTPFAPTGWMGIPWRSLWGECIVPMGLYSTVFILSPVWSKYKNVNENLFYHQLYKCNQKFYWRIQTMKMSARSYA